MVLVERMKKFVIKLWSWFLYFGRLVNNFLRNIAEKCVKITYRMLQWEYENPQEVQKKADKKDKIEKQTKVSRIFIWLNAILPEIIIVLISLLFSEKAEKMCVILVHE